ncbi:MAG: chaperone modulator CbpM [Desulfotomaculaceae bacterium]|nr:chaperone modulator CbpM [Desulfotomaculaceae bacterium]
MTKYYLQIYQHTLATGDDEAWVDLESLGIHPDLAQRLAEFGIVEIFRGHVRANQAERLLKLLRLRSNLGVNLHGAAIILDLLDRIEALQDEIERLRGI